MELSIVVSAFNEEQNMKRLFHKLTSVLDEYKINAEIVFLNNHSTDKTGELADHFSRKDKRIKVIHRYNRENNDLGSSLREGFRNCSGKYILIMDADLSHDPKNIKDLLEYKRDADIIIGSRFTRGGRADMSFSRMVISRVYNFFVGLLLGMKVKDITTGFKLYNRKVLKNLNLVNNGFGLHVEILLKAVRQGYKTKEIPIYYRARTHGKSKLNYRKQFKTYTEPVFKQLFHQ